MATPSASTPCRGICVLDPGNLFCTGCGRTLAEIAAWGTMSEAERQRVMEALPARLADGSDSAVRAPAP